MDVESALAATPLLSSLDRKTIRRLAEQGKHRSYAAGEAIVREGAPASALYIILSGKVHFELLLARDPRSRMPGRETSSGSWR